MVAAVGWSVPFAGGVTVSLDDPCKREQQFALHTTCDNPESHFRIKI